ncbi:MAG: glycosyltransferase family 1 protein [Acaryochloridaceae cyanobacterium SU_2_1]|nr:glycosyltransferase family 1 protein [Acaryochloridaceae cyanobacterium SU_2_1]
MVAVGVLIDLKWHRGAGGHVKCWEAFAQAATILPEQLDLSLHFLGEQQDMLSLSNNVRYLFHPPRFSTERLPFLKDVPGHTDIAAYNAALLPYLDKVDVVHTTHPQFTFGKTALRYCQTHHKPLVTSIHTDTPEYSRIYTQQTLSRLFGEGYLNQLLSRKLQIPYRYQQLMLARQRRYWQVCDHVFTAQPSDLDQVQQVLPVEQISHLRRGINPDQFHPRRGDRNWLEQTYGIPPHKFLLLFVGRLDACKNVMTYAQTLKILLEQDLPFHGLIVGQGDHQTDIEALLGEHVSLPGIVSHDQLGPIYASADLFVFPSQTETIGNVVIEAKASGLPVLVSAQGGAHQSIGRSGVDGVIVSEDTASAWAETIVALYQAPEKLAALRQATIASMQQRWPTWQDVLKEDLLPVWQAVASAYNGTSTAWLKSINYLSG